MIGEDLKSYDHGTFQLATHNIPTNMLNGTLGELYVYYKVHLRKPKFLTGRGLAITRALYVSNGSETTSLITGGTANMLRGQQNNLNVLLTEGSFAFDPSTPGTLSAGLQFTFPAYFAGNVQICISVEGSGLSGNIANLGAANQSLLAGQVAVANDMYASSSTTSDSPSWFISTGGTLIGNMALIFHLKVQPAVNAANNTIAVKYNFSAGTITQTCIDICEYNSSFNGVSGAPVLVNQAGTVIVP